MIPQCVMVLRICFCMVGHCKNLDQYDTYSLI